jgi:squalene-associated FAD-dependent desaturase
LTVSTRTLAVVGGGLAGIAAAESAAGKGLRPVLFERAGVLGGRVASLLEPARKKWIDTGQHILLGCCSEVLALNHRLGLDRFFQPIDSLSFFDTKNCRWNLTASRFLPKRWQLLPAFLKMPFLPLSERIKTCFLLQKLNREHLPGTSINDWLKRHAVSQNALDTFWTPLILSSLSDTADHAAFAAVQKVIRDGFLGGRKAMTIHLPVAPLRTIYHDAASESLLHRGVSLRFFKRLRRLHWEGENDQPKITALEFSDKSIEQFDDYLLAIPAFQLWKILDASGLTEYADRLGLDRFEPGAITTAHLWLDRPIWNAGQRCCTLLGGIGQFLCRPNKTEHYYTVVISASHRLLTESEMTVNGSEALAEKVLEQLRSTFRIPALRLIHYRLTTSFDAVFSPNPSIYEQRPESSGLFVNGAIAGDWTQTYFPATMEGAVRSGIR